MENSIDLEKPIPQGKQVLWESSYLLDRSKNKQKQSLKQLWNEN